MSRTSRSKSFIFFCWVDADNIVDTPGDGFCTTDTTATDIIEELWPPAQVSYRVMHRIVKSIIDDHYDCTKSRLPFRGQDQGLNCRIAKLG